MEDFPNNGDGNNTINTEYTNDNTNMNIDAFNNTGFTNPDTNFYYDSTGFANTDINNMSDNSAFNNIDMYNNSEYTNNNIYKVDASYQNQDFKPKKSKKGLIILLIVIIVVTIIAIGVLFWFKNKASDNTNSQVATNSIETTDKNEKNGCAMALDLTSIQKDNKYIKCADSQDSYRILKPYGNVEGIVNITDDDIYKVTINTDNFMIFEGGGELCANFLFLDADGEGHKSLFIITDDEDAYDEITSSDTKSKGKEYSYNDWKYCKIKGGCICYYTFERYENDYVVASMSINGDNFEDMSESDYKEFSEAVIDRINLERIGEYNSGDGVEYPNILSNVDLSDIVVSDSIKLDLLSNYNVLLYVIKQYDGEYTVENQLRLDSKDGKYIVFITESDAKTIKVVEEDAILNKHTWETCLINDEEVYIELWENGSFGELHIDNNGEIISISLMGTGTERTVSYEDAINYLGETLFK